MFEKNYKKGGSVVLFSGKNQPYMFNSKIIKTNQNITGHKMQRGNKIEINPEDSKLESEQGRR